MDIYMYKIAGFILLINMSCGWCAELGLGYTSSPNYMNETLTEGSLINDVLGNDTGGTSIEATSTLDLVGFLGRAVNLLIKVIYQTTMGLPLMLYNPPFSFPETIVATIIMVQVVVYGVGLADFFRG